MIKAVRRLYEEVYTKGNLKVCDELFSPHLKLNDTANPKNKPGIAAFKECEHVYIKAFPTKKAKIEDIFASDNKVVVRWSCQGKQDGELKDFPASHRTFQITGISIYEFRDEKISEIWQSWDRLGLLEQLNAIQSPAHALH